jgi:Ca2+-binding EF-hand superfamily protein
MPSGGRFKPNQTNIFTLGRIYDKEGLGYITTDTLRGLIGELLAPLEDEELEGILEELDEDGSGSMDFDEFCEMMMTKPE